MPEVVRTSRFRSYLTVQMAAAAIAAVMLVFMDFGGFHYDDRHGDVQEYVFFGSGAIPTALICLGAGGLAVAFANALRLLKKKEVSAKELGTRLRLSDCGAVFASVLVTAGALVLIATNWNADWWLDGGFFGAFIGGWLLVFVIRLMRRHIE